MTFLKCLRKKNSTQFEYLKTNTQLTQTNVAIVVKLNTNSPWHRDVAKVLSKLEGVHAFKLDVEQGTIKVLGNIQPEKVMKVISKSTKNAEISKAYMTKDGFNQDLWSSYQNHLLEYHDTNGNNVLGTSSSSSPPGPPSPSPLPLSSPSPPPSAPSWHGECNGHGHGHGHGYGYNANNYYQQYYSPPVPKYCYPPQVQVEPYYETKEESLCSVM